MNLRKTDPGQMDEFVKSLHRILKEHRSLKQFRYFVNQSLQWYQRIRSGQIESRVVILGTGIPEELVMGAGETPFRILGGSHESCQWSDDLVPRDTDPVSRSVLGFLQCLSDDRDLLYIVPLYSDSMRKIAYQLLREGKKVFPVDFPPEKQMERSQRIWSRQMIRMTEAVAEHVRGKMNASSMKAAIRVTSRARIALHEFSLTAPEHGSLLSPAARILVRNSYYYTQDLARWTQNLRKLMEEMEQLSERSGIREPDRPKVLLMGSPVYCPNDKIPRLLTEAGLRIWRQADSSEYIQYIIPKVGRNGRSLRKMAEAVALTWYRADTSPAALRNEVMRRRIRSLCRTRQLEGVVFHVLKGQIHPDFELSYYEGLMEKLHIPVFRLETDYQYQDVEQLRIRMEAFTEMLEQNRCRSAKEAV